MSGSMIGRLFGIQTYKDKTAAVVLTAQETVYNALLVFLTFTALIWMSIFLYATFYYTYLPAVSHLRPVYLQFRVCGRGDSQELCSFPSANVTLTHKEQFLTVGQPYKIALELEMPESPANQNLGMFMACGYLKNKDGNQISKSCRSAMFPYRSIILHAIATFVFSPFLLAGSSEQKQKIEIELFSNYMEQRLSPTTDAYVQIESHKIEIYRSSLRIIAQFTGLRHFMFHWPLPSAVVGIVINMFFLTIIAFLSWYKYFSPVQNIVQVAGYDKTKAKDLEERRKHRESNKMKLIRMQQSRMQETSKSTCKEDLAGEAVEEECSKSSYSENNSSERDESDESIEVTGKNSAPHQCSSDEFEVLLSKATEAEKDQLIEDDKENRPQPEVEDPESHVRNRLPRTGS